MKKEIFKADSRGFADYGWLKTNYSFSFANYHDPARMGFGALRVLNDDLIEGGGGFPFHSHENMEIVTIPITGTLEHKDTAGGEGIINAGDVQIMSAGFGITHSEFNHSKKEAVSLFQIWILPDEHNVTPRYEQKTFDVDGRKNAFQLVVSPTHKGALFIHQKSYISLGELDKNKILSYNLYGKGTILFIFVISGEILIENETLSTRDAMGISDISSITLEAKKSSSLLLIEVPGISSYT